MATEWMKEGILSECEGHIVRLALEMSKKDHSKERGIE